MVREHLIWKLAACACLMLCAAGCVRRRLTVRSNPPGAMVFVDKEPIGVTPASTDYIYYAPREFKLSKDGYERVTELRTFDPPWYQWPPLDFFAENLWPFEIRDEREVHFELEPQRIVPRDEVLGRAEDLRLSAHRGYATPMVNRGAVAPQASLPPPSRNAQPSNQAPLRLPAVGGP